MKYQPYQSLQQVLPMMCSCGKHHHNNNPHKRYLFPNETGEFYNTPGGGTVGSMQQYFPNTDELIDFIVNQSRIFPERSCPEIIEELSSLGDEDEQEIAKTFVITIIDEMMKITNMNDVDWERMKKELQPIVIVTEDKRIEDTMINKPGICQCGCKHVLNGKAFKYFIG